MPTKTNVLGDGDVQLAVDRTFKAARIALRPLDYSSEGRILGHYAVAQRSGELVATIGALGHLASMRWSDGTAYCVLMRIKAGWSVSGAVTTAVEMNLRAIIARAFTVDFTTAATAANMAVPPRTGAMRANMGSSLMGVSGPRISTTTVQSGQTLTADANGFAACVWPGITSIAQTAAAATVNMALGTAGLMQTLYEYTALSQHPVILSQNEGILLQPITAGPATGTFALYTQWEWAEVEVF